MTDRARPAHARAARPRLVERYRRFLPVTDATPAADPRRGRSRRSSTRAAPRRGPRPREPLSQGRGPEPDRLVQGPRAWSSPWRRRPRRARERSSAPRPATPRPRRRPTARPPGSRSSSSCRRARSRSASCSRRWSPAPGSSPSTATSTRRSAIVRALAEQDDHPVTLVNSVNPFRLEGQKTGRLRDLRRARPRARRARHPGRQRRQHQRLLGRVPRLRGGRAGGRDPADVGLPGGRRRAARRRPPDRAPGDRRDRDPDRRSGVVDARRSRRATRSGGRIDAVTDDEILAAYRDARPLRGHLLRAGLGGERRRRDARRPPPASSTPTRPSSAS